MTSRAISVEQLSKVYRIGVKEQSHDTIGRAVIDFVKSPLSNYRKYRSLYKFSEEELQSGVSHDDLLWALKDVSFDVRPGEVVGIIGTNDSPFHVRLA